MIWVLGFIVFLFVEVFGPKTRVGALLFLCFLSLCAFISVLCDEGEYFSAFCVACLPVLAVVRAVRREIRREKRNEEEKETYGEILSEEDRAFVKMNGQEAFILKQLKEGNYFMLSGEEAKRKNQIGRIPWLEEQREKRKAMGEDRWFDGQKKLYELGFKFQS